MSLEVEAGRQLLTELVGANRVPSLGAFDFLMVRDGTLLFCSLLSVYLLYRTSDLRSQYSVAKLASELT